MVVVAAQIKCDRDFYVLHHCLNWKYVSITNFHKCYKLYIAWIRKLMDNEGSKYIIVFHMISPLWFSKEFSPSFSINYFIVREQVYLPLIKLGFKIKINVYKLWTVISVIFRCISNSYYLALRIFLKKKKKNSKS